MKHYEVRITCDCCAVEAVQSNGFTNPSAAEEHAIQLCEAADWYYSEHCWTCRKCEERSKPKPQPNSGHNFEPHPDGNCKVCSYPLIGEIHMKIGGVK